MKLFVLALKYLLMSFASVLIISAFIPSAAPFAALIAILFPLVYFYYIGTHKKKKPSKRQKAKISYCDEYFEFSPPVPVHIVYTDSKNETTNRTVNVSRFDGTYIAGYCSLRKAFRTFRVDRVHEVADAQTGEVKKDICKYFIELYKSSGSYEVDNAFDTYYELLRFIKYFVNVDFSYSNKEKYVVRKIIRSLDGCENLSDKNIDNMMEYIDVPSLHSFRVIVGKVIKMDNLPSNIMDLVEELAMSDGEVNDYEKNTIRYIKQRLEKHNKLQ